MRALVLVEGPSDVNAVVALASVLDVDLSDVEVHDLGGITNVRAVLASTEADWTGVLHDAGESGHVRRVLADQALLEPERTVERFECVADLEDELIRALGLGRAGDVVEAAGDLAAWHTISRQPFHRDRPADQVLRRFLGAGSGRKKRYGTLLAEACAPDDVPAPLVDLLTSVRRVTRRT